MNYHQLASATHKEYSAQYSATNAVNETKSVSPKALQTVAAVGAALLTIITILI